MKTAEKRRKNSLKTFRFKSLQKTSSESTLEIDFGSMCLFLLTIITVLGIIIWLQRKEIRRLMRFFHGRPVPQHDDEQGKR
jgi:hypothetical protein